MKKRLLALFVILMVPRLCWGQAPWDVIYHSISVTPAFEVASEVVAIGKMGVQQATNVQSVIMQAKAVVTNAQTAVMTTFNSIVNGSILSELAGNTGDIPGQFFGKNLTKVKPKKIVKKFKKLFLTYDSKKGDDIVFVNENRRKFYQENLLELNATASVLLAKLANEIKPKIEMAQECAEGDGSKCGIPSTSSGGKNEVWYAYASTLEQYDRLIKLMETVAAIRARYIALTSMLMIEPMLASEAEKAEDEKNNGDDVPDEKDDKEKTAFNGLIKSRGFSHTSMQMAFAQVMYKSPTRSLSEVETQIKVAETPAEKMITNVIDFVSPEESQAEHPLIANEEKLESLNEVNAVKEIVDNAIEAHNCLGDLKNYRETAEQMKKAEEDYAKILEKLKKSEQCSLKYMGKYFKNPIQAWSGINLTQNVGRHDLRKGISGWAVAAFETAKEAETSNITTDDIEQYSMDDKEALEDADDPDFSKAEGRASKISTSLGPGKLEAAQQETRRSNLVSWQIGAEASKILGENPSKWGKPSGKSMIWTDTKRFYNQYLQRKYENIEGYLQSYTKEDILAVVINKLKKKKGNISDTNYQKKRRELAKTSADERQDEIKKMKVSMQDYDKSVSAELESLMTKRKALVAKMDERSNKIKKASDQIADMKQVAEEKASEQTEEQLLPDISFPDPEDSMGEKKITDKVPHLTSVEETKELTLSSNTNTLDEKKIEELEKEIKNEKALREKEDKELKALDEQIDVVKLSAQEKRNGLNKISAIIDTIKNKIEQSKEKNIQSYASDINANLDAILPDILGPNIALLPAAKETLIAAAEKSLKDINNQVSIAVKASYMQMMALGDELYKPSAHQKLVKIHQQMINNIKAISLVYVATGIIEFEKAAILEELLIADTSEETEGFFVGSEPKERDLKAPYKIPNFDLPPVREVFHFDVTDFKAIKPRNEKFTNRNLKASEFLNYGGDVPKIWKYMLGENSFIESQYNLKNALSGGCEDVAFARGGIMPCVVEGSKIIMDVNGKGDYIRRTDLAADGLPKCLLVDIKKGKPHHMVTDVSVIFYTPPIIFGGVTEEVKGMPRNCEYSELGMLLDADESNNLSFKPLAYSTYMTLLNNSGDDIKKMSDNTKNKIAAANHAILSRNQIGDFLRHVEEETDARKNVEELRQQYEEEKEELKQKLQKFGFTPSKSFDLSNAKDYENAATQIKLIKDQQVLSAQNALNAINVTENKPAQQQKDILKKLLNLMEKDKEANINISDISADISNPDEELKKGKADSAVVDKLKNSLKEKEKEYTDIDQVFCANYGE